MNKHGSDEIVAPRLGVERRLGVIFLRRMPVVNIAAAFALLRAAISKRNKQPSGGLLSIVQPTRSSTEYSCTDVYSTS